MTVEAQVDNIFQELQRLNESILSNLSEMQNSIPGMDEIQSVRSLLCSSNRVYEEAQNAYAQDEALIAARTQRLKRVFNITGLCFTGFS